MPLSHTAPRTSLDRFFDRLERVSDWHLFGFCVLWVLAGGLLLQLVVLPYVIPSAHWGHGLILAQDSVGFHIAAVEKAETIRSQGWSAWRPTEASYSIALASMMYALTRPEPWVILPVNGILFGVGLVAVRRLLAVIFDSRATGLIALTPFFIFPSFVPIWGQMHRDLNTGVGFSLVLLGLVLSTRKGAGYPRTLTCAVISLTGMGLVWSSRSYALTLAAAGTVAFVALGLLARRCERSRLFTVGVVVVLAATSTLVNWSQRFTPAESATDTTAVAALEQSPAARPGDGGWTLRLPRLRRVDLSLPRGNNCLPAPSGSIFDGLLHGLCYVREGFIVDSMRFRAGSGYDYDVRLRTAEDFVAYAPRAVELALLEPAPNRWMRETTPIGSLGRYLIPFEMLVAYSAFLLAAVFAYRRLWRFDVWAPVAFCITYILFYVYATSQLGTLYRMRAFAFAILVSTALAAVVARLRERRVRTDITNIDEATVRGFGDEWRRFDQSVLSVQEKQELFDAYFRIFPFSQRSSTWQGFDAGCGSGRWASLVAVRVHKLHVIDASEEALAVAKRNLSGYDNCEFHLCSIDDVPIPDQSMDFGYSLGVLHHIPDTPRAMAACVRKLKPGAPFLVYVYYALDHRPRWFKVLWRVSDALRRAISRTPRRVRYQICKIIATTVYWPIARLARCASDAGHDVRNWPLAFYAHRSFYAMRTDALDRFGTRLEQRFSRAQLEQMMLTAGLENVQFSPDPPYWCAVGYRSRTPA